MDEMRDTSPEEQRRYYERLSRLSVAERARIVAAASSRMRMFVRAGIAHYHPGASEEELRARLAVRLYGREAAERMFEFVPPDAR